MLRKNTAMKGRWKGGPAMNNADVGELRERGAVEEASAQCRCGEYREGKGVCFQAVNDAYNGGK